MSKKFSWSIISSAIALCASLEASDNLLMPIVELSLTPPPIGDYGAFSAFGELGDRNMRGTGTYGVYLAPCHRLKISGEYLTQRLDYHYFPEERKEWTAQYALGTAYQYLLPSSAFQSIDAGASYSHAFGETYNEYARIAGSDAGFGYLGTSIRLWRCGYLSPAVNYDFVQYNRHFKSNRFARGFGGTLNYVQILPRDTTMTLTSEFRQPFFFYEAAFNWTQDYDGWSTSLGLYANYTDGRKGLPNVTTAGIQVGFSFGERKQKCCRNRNNTYSPSETPPPQKQEPVKTEKKDWFEDCYARMYCDVMNWVSTPAVYLPVVLAIKENRSDCPWDYYLAYKEIADLVIKENRKRQAEALQRQMEAAK